MTLYKKQNRTHWHFTITLSLSGGRKRCVINSQVTEKRVAMTIMQKTQALAECVEGQMPITPELRGWLEKCNAKLKERLANLGLISDADVASAKALEHHVEDYLSDCSSQGHGNDFVKIKRSQLTRAIKYMEAKSLRDFTLDRVSEYLCHLKKSGSSNRTRNQHRSTIISCLNWCVQRERLPRHDIDRIPRINEDVDRRRERRAATQDEVDKFLAVAPDHRRYVYLSALYTGLRRGEMNQIERRDIDFESATLTVRAEVGKTRQAVVLPIHADLMELLQKRVYAKKPQDLVFKPVPRIETFRRDLAKAGIAFKDENGRQLDFHALRSTFATRLLREGVHPSIARRLTRHASVKTLEKHYDKLGIEDAQQVIARLPGFRSRRDGAPH